MPEFTSPPLVLLIVAGLSYLLGSIPFGIVITRAMGLGDIRQIGSGNIGATNVLRTGNKPAAFLTLVLDAGKGAIAVIAARLLVGEDAAQVAGGFAFLGHLWPVWLGFKGGKGVATFLGTLLALAWPIGLLACATWAATAAITRISSLSALTAAALSPAYALLTGQPQFVLLTILLAALIFVRHDANIRRLIAGTEPRIGKKTEG
ncbi:MAG: glycerol-3-phosphate 1-O-acyltransferase PlsY [Rhodobacteraceae bacterium]|nr:glycerol-3-phosphate 1-O-acyltransferase PlsY [Paracoccaceae bacterium]